MSLPSTNAWRLAVSLNRGSKSWDRSPAGTRLRASFRSIMPSAVMSTAALTAAAAVRLAERV